MRKFLLLLTSGMLAVNFAASAQAGDYGKPAMGMDKMKGDRMGMGEMKRDCMGMDKMKDECVMMGWHKMTGTVDKIDHAKGVLTLKSGAPDMTLHFPPDSIKDLKNGDTITVKLGLMKGQPPSTD